MGALAGQPRLRRRLAVGVAAGAAMLVVAFAAWSLWVVANPASVVPERVDAVAVHAGEAEERVAAAVALAEAGVTDVLVIAVGSGEVADDPALAALCGRREPYRVECVRTEPFTTIGEARAFGTVFAEHGAERVAVVTSRFHLARASAVVGQCTDAEILPVAADDRWRLRRVPGEWVRYLASLTVARAC